MSDEGSVRYFEKMKARGENMTPEQEDRYRIAKENLNKRVAKPSPGFRKLSEDEMYESPISKFKRGISNIFVEPKEQYEKRKQREYEIKETYNQAYHQEAIKAAKKKASKDAHKKQGVGGFFERLGSSGFVKGSMNEMGQVFRNAHANTFGPMPTYGGEGWSSGKRKKRRGVYLGGGDIDFI